MHDPSSPLNGMNHSQSSPDVKRRVRMTRFLVPLVIFAVALLLTFLLSGCGSWLNNTRTTLLATNAGLNAYDDVAVELWRDAPTNQKAKKDLGISACACVMVQDQIIQAWAVTTAVDHGLKKKDDVTPYISAAIGILDSLEDYLEMSGYPLPTELKAVWAQLEAINPGGVLAPDSEPLEVCIDVLSEKVPIAGMSVPWEAILRSAGNMAMFLYEVITNSLEGRDVPEEALETYIRDPHKQLILYDAAMGDEGSP